MSIIGIDPGLAGGWAVIDPHSGKFIDGGRMPTVEFRGKQIVDGDLLSSHMSQAHRMIIEQVHAMPRQGVTSSFRFGMAYGAILALAQAQQLPFETVTPAVWKKHFKLSSSKRASLDMAKSFWPQAKVEWNTLANDGIAEAALLCMWHVDKHRGYK